MNLLLGLTTTKHRASQTVPLQYCTAGYNRQAVYFQKKNRQDEDGALRGHVITLEVQRRWARLGWAGDHARTTGEEGRKKCPAGLILQSPLSSLVLVLVRVSMVSVHLPFHVLDFWFPRARALNLAARP